VALSNTLTKNERLMRKLVQILFKQEGEVMLQHYSGIKNAIKLE
jgi:hypothetical protein